MILATGSSTQDGRPVLVPVWRSKACRDQASLAARLRLGRRTKTGT